MARYCLTKYSTVSSRASASSDPVATSTESGTVRIRWAGLWDRDDERLTYDLYRDNPAHGLRDQGRRPVDFGEREECEVVEAAYIRIGWRVAETGPAHMVGSYWRLEGFCDRMPELAVTGGTGKEKDFFRECSHCSVLESEIRQRCWGNLSLSVE